MCTKYTRICVTGFPINDYDADDESLGPLTPPTEVSSPPALEEFAEQIFNYAAWGIEPPVIPDNAGKYPAPPNSSNYELDVNALTEQLAQVALYRTPIPHPRPSAPTSSNLFGNGLENLSPSPTWDLLSGPPYHSSTRLCSHGKTIGTRFAPPRLKDEGDMDFDIGEVSKSTLTMSFKLVL
ncbi:hypothetical protein RHS01_03680 [Rhizoctonia solani]|uniref:Uncharacterized protein n=1 Tax=Rhizoctonia solani TaxID=456999 RepID=A0A8H7IG82_9AGAM|nr:hypothetical protein RHS01_03680 [Rhizoctonia solani]